MTEAELETRALLRRAVGVEDEAGHWVGMGHTKTTDLCNDQTMYPSIGAGDSSKRVLGVGDTTGISALYN